MDSTRFELINLREIDPTILIDAAYARADTFVGFTVYPVNELFLMKPAAERLARAQRRLQALGLGLKCWDAYRPLSLQKILWKHVLDERYIANPATGSRHNRGCAVDVTLVDREGHELPMPTPYLEFSERAHRDWYSLPPGTARNRQTLEDAMVAEGFIPLPEEWWHFDAPEWERYPVLDINPYGKDYRI
ncbi:MAG TPA: M15 family metallopeptidase [bacterium]|nr:M15 family metallopeptidase [bacterium]HOL94449.1 M15 family metallopeptidase [bacterium]HXK95945.1 M15 family metallopeptidase [bacterium]